MITKEGIIKLFNEWLPNDKIFLVEATVSKGSKISVLIDRLDGLNVADCVSLSRFIEGNLDREKEDFELNVSSPGADSPFTVPQQYLKNIGRNVKVTDNENVIYEGLLNSYNEEQISILTKQKKSTEKKEVLVPLKKIKETRVIISFK